MSLAQLRRVPTRVIARVVGASESTVRRWKRGSRISPKFVDRLKALSDLRAPTKRAQKAYLARPGAQLARELGVSLEEARRIKRRGTLPDRYVWRLWDHADRTEALRFTRSEVSRYVGVHYTSKFWHFELNPRARLTPEYVDWLLAKLLRAVPSHTDSRYQAVLYARVDSEYLAVTSYGTVDIMAHERVDANEYVRVKLPTDVYMSVNDLLYDTVRQSVYRFLSELEVFSATLDKIIVIARGGEM